MAGTPASAGAPDPQQRRAIRACILGNILEWYDFAIFAFLVPTIASLFFPASSPLDGKILAYAALAVGFLVRPLGGIAFGICGDRIGRRKALAAAMAIMAAATGIAGLLPTYATAGILSPILLVIVRLAQGLSAGGERSGAIIYLVERAPPDRRGATGSWQQLSIGIGLLLGSMVARLISGEWLMTHDAFLGWGWRLPFLLGTLVGAAGAYIRWRVDETPPFRALAQRGALAAAPLHQTLARHRRATLTAFGIAVHGIVAYYVVLGAMANYLATIGALPQAAALTISTVGIVVFLALIPAAGALSDRLGRKKLMMTSCAGYLVLVLPLLHLTASGNFGLALVAQIALVVMLALYAGPAPALYSELFPTAIRYTALSLAYNCAAAIFGGLAPFIVARLLNLTGYDLAPGLYVMAAAAVSLLVLSTAKETAFAPLR